MKRLVLSACFAIVLIFVGRPFFQFPGEDYDLLATYPLPISEEGEASQWVGLVIDDKGSFWVSDAARDVIYRLDRAGRVQGRIDLAYGGEPVRPMHFTVQGETLFLTSFIQDRLFRYDLATSRLVPLGKEGSTVFDGPGAIVVDPRSGDWYVTDFYHHQVVHGSKAGEVMDTFGGDGSRYLGDFHYPTDLEEDGMGHVWVADGYAHRLQQLDPTTGSRRRVGGFHGLGVKGPFRGWFNVVSGLGMDRQGNIYAADFYNHRVQKFSPEGRLLAVLGTGTGLAQVRLRYPTDVAVAHDGTVYVLDSGNHRMVVYQKREEG